MQLASNTSKQQALSNTKQRKTIARFISKMPRQNISGGSPFEDQIGYCRAVVLDDGWIHVSGTTGYNYATGEISPDVAAQAEQTLANIDKALADAGACMADVVRVRYILPDRADFAATWPVLQRYFGAVRPAATMIQAALMKDEMKIEIEVTAKKGCSKP